MKNVIGALTLLLAACGCKTSSSSTQQAQFQSAAFAHQQAMAAQVQQVQQPSVFVRGEVNNQIIPWNEDLTLARAIVAAEYRGPWDPRHIFIIRKGQSFRVNPKHLLWGTQDPLLEAGDTIVIER